MEHLEDAYTICYQRCDPDYETVPHIHTTEGIFIVDSELDALKVDHGQEYDVVILNDIQSVVRMNGHNYPCFQTCGTCYSRFVGSQNWTWCPKCSNELPHAIDLDAPNVYRHPTARAVKPPRIPLGTCVRCHKYPCECVGRVITPRSTPRGCPNCGCVDQVNVNCSNHILFTGEN